MAKRDHVPGKSDRPAGKGRHNAHWRRIPSKSNGCIGCISRKISNYKAERVRVIGTSALRSTSNSDDVISKIRSYYHWEVSIIDGEAEARYIFVGTMEALQISDETCLIMDIGAEVWNSFLLKRVRCCGGRVCL